MDYLSGKVTMMVGEASSRVNETRRKWQQQSDIKQHEADANDIQSSSAINLQNQKTKQHEGAIMWPLSGGIPFGGDTFTQSNLLRQPAPPIGFRTELLDKTPESITTSPQPIEHHTSAGQATTGRPELGDSDESLYKGDAWARLWFQRVMLLSLLRLLLFIRKVYEDFQATKMYNSLGQTGHLLIAATTLLLPTIVFTIYRVSRYLQITLPPLRVIRQSQQPYPTARVGPPTEDTKPDTKRARFSSAVRTEEADDEVQMRRALMSSPLQSTTDSIRPSEREAMAASPNVPPIEDNEGLVTARQTPTNAEEFHDSKSQQAPSPDLEMSLTGQEVPVAPTRTSRLKALPQRAPSNSLGPQLESVHIEKLLPSPAADRETTRVVTGASEQLLHGILFIFWQLKRQVDVMGYLVERACLWRRPAEREKEELERLRTGSDGLEWFQDFYAAFLAILAQVYTLGLHLSGNDNSVRNSNQLSAATSSLSASDNGNELSISNSARAFSNLVGSQAVAGNRLGGKDVLIMSELIVSTAVVLSLLIAVRRRDDGPMTFGLSLIGWGSLFAARIIIIALSFVHLGWHLMLPLVIVHVLSISGWIYSIALDSHNNKPGERFDEATWDEETAIEVTNQLEMGEVQVNDNATGQQQVSVPQASKKLPQPITINETSKWSFMEHVVLLAQILSLFAIPSLFYWPIMFNLKLHFRPFKYLVLILIENFSLITGIWFNTISETASAAPGQLYLLGFVGGFSILGFIFISLYIMCKPDLTEYFAQADEQFNLADKSGIYYEFCSRVFKMPDLSKQTFRRLMNQSEVVEEVAE